MMLVVYTIAIVSISSASASSVLAIGTTAATPLVWTLTLCLFIFAIYLSFACYLPTNGSLSHII